MVVKDMRKGDLSQLTGMAGMVAGAPFAIAAATVHGTPGLLVGAAVVLVASLASSDRVFWLVTLLLLNRHQRWAWAQTRSAASTGRLTEPARGTVETIARARLAALREDNAAGAALFADNARPPHQEKPIGG
ncbi:hypothetical protein ACFO8L_27790 [Sphaerisporangium corydalis]|uniref:PrgI family protein n=2 Tax=Sphaerisporangium corydalis TaxID=1441875 RepID=A0ABV9EN38_9ACTN